MKSVPFVPYDHYRIGLPYVQGIAQEVNRFKPDSGAGSRGVVRRAVSQAWALLQRIQDITGILVVATAGWRFFTHYFLLFTGGCLFLVLFRQPTTQPTRVEALSAPRPVDDAAAA